MSDLSDAFFDNLPSGAVAIGNFDGVHLGHAQLIEHLKRKVAGTRKADIIYVFENKLNVLKGLNPFSFTMYLA